jgi:gas vesicle protein
MSDPDQIRAEIEQTRGELSTDVNALADKVNPSKAAKRQVGRVRGVANRAKDKVMGAASDLGSSTSSAGSSATSTLSDAPAKIQSQTAGNPLAAGLIAFGVGWLVGSLLPVTEQEQQAAGKIKDTAMPVVSDAAKQVADNLKEPAQQSVDAVKETASAAVDTVKDEGASAADDVKGHAQDAKETVQQSR